ncbi:MAG TPA: MFS transporter permease [Microbacteriaceae bacterium]|nr:MFS transporter permease [Microbacteriaceae bacterium]HRA08489.1 MFS transporter permease [Microbacteriaceae bacterium]
MFLRRGFYAWLFPAALVLPLWLLIGWGVFTGGGLAFLWVLFIACPSVFLGQLLIAFLIRSRGTVRASQAVSWWDVLGLTVWHGLTIAAGFYSDTWFAPVLVAAIIAGFGLIALSFRQLLAEARPVALRYTSFDEEATGAATGAGRSVPPMGAPRSSTPRFEPGAGDVFVIDESDRPRP